MVAHQQQRGDARSRQAHDTLAPGTLEGRLRVAVFVGVAGEDDQIDPLGDGRVNDLIERLQEIDDALWQACLLYTSRCV